MVQALVFEIRLNSLYSIRLPYTWQCSLTYPILPPSAVIGMLANALQRYKNDKHPLDYLSIIDDEANLLWAGSRLLSPCIIKSYTTSAITQWGSNFPWKFTNALGRQFAFTHKIQIAAVFSNHGLSEEIARALQSTPITCGDSESAAFIDGRISNLAARAVVAEEIETEFPVPYTPDTEIIDGNCRLLWMHKNCKKLRDKDFPLVGFLVPVREECGVLKPSSVKVRVPKAEVYMIDGVGYVIARASAIVKK
ncbi:MAG: CRISPR-associated protein Cas5 [candidate division WOR-3 bacterium]|nr:CRISPR-associated protein Cas5 [candidate division WOR-3 bacterium]